MAPDIPNAQKEDTIGDCDFFFDISGSVKWIVDNGYHRIALQFPDRYLRYSKYVADELETRAAVKVFILADSSYSSCCVDILAADHAKIDCIIHYGDACLSQIVDKYPVHYVFGLGDLKIEFLMKIIADNHELLLKNSILLYDAIFSHSSTAIMEALSSFPNIFHCSLLQPGADCNSNVSMGRTIPKNFSDMSDVLVFFIGEKESSLLPLWLMTHPNCSKVLSYFPQDLSYTISSSNTTRQLRRRLYMIEKLKDANTLGLVVGTLSTLGYKEIIKRIRELCRNAEKKLYVISVGKINPYKLANFATEIDAFIFLSCPHGIIMDTTDYCFPVVSAFEAEAALNPDHQWYSTSGWTSEFSKFLKDKIGHETVGKVDVSLITGRIRKLAVDDDDESSSNHDIINNKRTWNGLDEKLFDDNLNLEIRKGKSGVASAYHEEIEKKVNNSNNIV